MYERGNERLLCVAIEIIASVYNSHSRSCNSNNVFLYSLLSVQEFLINKSDIRKLICVMHGDFGLNLCSLTRGYLLGCIEMVPFCLWSSLNQSSMSQCFPLDN